MTAYELVRRGLREIGLPEQRIDDLFALDQQSNPLNLLDQKTEIPDDQVPQFIALVKHVWHMLPSERQALHRLADSNSARFAARN